MANEGYFGIPEPKNVIILVVTVTGRGVDLTHRNFFEDSPCALLPQERLMLQLPELFLGPLSQLDLATPGLLSA